MYDENPIPMFCGPNDGGVKRGDRDDTGDLEAQPTEKAGKQGSGNTGGSWGGHMTADPSALGSGPGSSVTNTGDLLGENTGGLDDLTVHDASDPELGLTNIGEVPAEDWAANTGPSRTEEAASSGTTEYLATEESTLSRPKRKRK
jgi:hypothetical protein